MASSSPPSRTFGAVCLNCAHTQPTLDSVAGLYFEGKQIICRNAACNMPVDYWQSVLNIVGREEVLLDNSLILLGAKTTHFDFQLRVGEVKEIDLTQYGVPVDATLLAITVSPQDADCFPQLIHSNRISLRSLRTKFPVYGLPGIGSIANGVIAASVTWAQKDDDANSWFYLLDALEGMASRRWSNVILPAFAAFEVYLRPLVVDGLRKHLSKKVVENFEGENSFSASSALNVLLPLLCKEAKIPLLPEVIQTQLNQLRKLRNVVIHEGVENTEISQKIAGEFLCASVFGLGYLRYIRPRLLG